MPKEEKKIIAQKKKADQTTSKEKITKGEKAALGVLAVTGVAALIMAGLNEVGKEEQKKQNKSKQSNTHHHSQGRKHSSNLFQNIETGALKLAKEAKEFVEKHSQKP